VSSLDDLIQLRAAIGTPWLTRSLAAGVVAMRRLRGVSDAAGRATHAVHGIGVGPKEVEGRLTPTLAVRVYVVQKLARKSLAPAARLPANLDGHPVDVVESRPAFIRSGSVPPQRRETDTLRAGISIGRDGVTFGTLGAICTSLLPEDRGKVLILSNSHVLVGPFGRPGDPVYQPGPGDAGRHLRQVGTLLRARHIEPGIIANRVDAAVATVSGVKHDFSIPGDVRRIMSTGTAQANTIVCKFGRTTGQTDGVVTDLRCNAVVGLDPTNTRRTATFIDQIRIDRRREGAVFADGGDSGSVILEQGTGRVIGLYFAGPINGSYGLANHIAAVTERLQIELST
jgi:hypothetical protein